MTLETLPIIVLYEVGILVVVALDRRDVRRAQAHERSASPSAPPPPPPHRSPQTMLFDLRSPHRRRVIKVVYVFLALLIGGGLIFFGSHGQQLGRPAFQRRRGAAAQTVRAPTPARSLRRRRRRRRTNDPASWAAVGRATFNLAQLPANYVSNQGYTASGHAVLTKLKQA